MSGSGPGPDPYDQVPYTSRPYSDTHPDHLRCLGRLFGLSPAPAATCSLLEIGCAGGGNLLPMAATMPGARFVGIDPSAVQIEHARGEAEALGLHNVRFLHVDVQHLPDELGTFDYVVCHGVWSWVSHDAQGAIFKTIRERLVAHGVGYVSYNVLPGWYQRLFIRDLMRFHGRGLTDPLERVAQGRAALDWITRSIPAQDGAYALVAKHLNDQMARVSDDYVLHEYLATHNEPVLFLDFMARAQAHGLTFLAEAEFETMVASDLGPDASVTLHRIATDVLSTEQYFDFLRHRSFRKTLLVHQEREIQRTIGWNAVTAFSVGSALRPVASFIPSEPGPIEFQTADGTTLTAEEPIIKAAWGILAARYPKAVPFERLVEEARTLLGETRPPRPEDREDVGGALLAALGAGLIHLALEEEPFRVEPGEPARALLLARRQAGHESIVTNGRHRSELLGPLDRRVLALLDGHRRPAEVVAELHRTQAEGDVWTCEEADQKMLDGEGDEARVTDRIEELGRRALLG